MRICDRCQDSVPDSASFCPSCGAELVSADGARLVLRLAASLDVPDMVAALVSAGARVSRVEPRDASLEDAYLALVQADA